MGPTKLSKSTIGGWETRSRAGLTARALGCWCAGVTAHAGPPAVHEALARVPAHCPSRRLFPLDLVETEPVGESPCLDAATRNVGDPGSRAGQPPHQARHEDLAAASPGGDSGRQVHGDAEEILLVTQRVP